MQANELTLQAAREHEAKLLTLAAPTTVGRPQAPKRPRTTPTERRASGLALRLVRFLIVLAVLAAAAGTASAGRSAATRPALEPDTLARVRTIRSELSARYALLPGRRLVVTEATTTGVVPTLTLVADWLEPRVVPSDDGIYYGICSARARCPYPKRSAAWRAAAFLPRRLALELALRTFAETSVTLVVVALPTRDPVWVVFEREDLLADIETLPLRDRLGDRQAGEGWLLPEVVGGLTYPRLFRPLPILPPPPDTIYAVPLLDP